MQGLTKAAYARLAKIGQSDPGYTPVALSFEDLEPKAHERALDKMREFAGDNFSDYASELIEGLKDNAPEYFDVDDIQYSGFWSQGDGASWTGGVNLTKWCEKNKPELLPFIKEGERDVYVPVVRGDSHHVHENSVHVDFYEHTDERMESKLLEIDELVTEDVRDYCREIYKELEDAYGAETSDESVLDMIEANDYKFTADGDLA